MGIEPTSQAWEARILPMNYTCDCVGIIPDGFSNCKGNFVTVKMHLHRKLY